MGIKPHLTFDTYNPMVNFDFLATGVCDQKLYKADRAERIAESHVLVSGRKQTARGLSTLKGCLVQYALG